MRWADGPKYKGYQPLPWWMHSAIGAAVGFATSYLIFVP